MPRTQRWTDEELIDAVDHSTSFKQVCDRLGLHPGGGTYTSLQRHMDRLGLETLHLERRERKRDRVRRAWTDDDLRNIVATSRSYTEVGRRLGYAPSGGAHRFVQSHIVRLGLDTSHFTGQGWAKGRRYTSQRRQPLAEILIKGSSYNTSRLRKRLMAAGLVPKHCQRCGRSTWFGEPMPLELDHINGHHTDNRLDNLRVLCPNCHAVTETWCNRAKPA